MGATTYGCLPVANKVTSPMLFYEPVTSSLFQNRQEGFRIHSFRCGNNMKKYQLKKYYNNYAAELIELAGRARYYLRVPGTK